MVLAGDQDTIVAQATASGRGAVAIIRLSGARAGDMARALGVSGSLAPRQATLVTLRDPQDGSLMDRALVTWFPAPRSYTGEEVVEFAPVPPPPGSPDRSVVAAFSGAARPLAVLDVHRLLELAA